MIADQLKQIYDTLYKSFGSQDWWPGETAFEMIVGAILTQNTAWTNVEKAIISLKKANVLTPEKLHALKIDKLAQLIRPAGYFNIKADRLKNLTNWLFKEYDGKLRNLEKIPTAELRRQLLDVKGVGPETADSILLYALNRPVFVVDAYTIRILSRHYLVKKNMDYHQVKEIFESNLPTDTQVFNEFHALLVRLGKNFCRPTPLCDICPLNSYKHNSSL
jgi:endonuclease-3 related protein